MKSAFWYIASYFGKSCLNFVGFWLEFPPREDKGPIPKPTYHSFCQYSTGFFLENNQTNKQ